MGKVIELQQLNTALNGLIDRSLIAQGERRERDNTRKYLGASRLGVNCSRLLQYEYMATCKDAGESFSARTRRIFAAGHVFEELAIDWLKGAGFTMLTHGQDGKQFGFKAAGGRVAGHVDGVIVGVPEFLEESIKLPALWEMKSMNNRSWKDTASKGLVVSKPIYAAQISMYQAYMEEQFTGISDNPCLFTAINKDSAELYHELVPFDGELAQRISDKAVSIIKACEADEMLPRIANSRDYYECKMCAYQEKCWSEVI